VTRRQLSEPRYPVSGISGFVGGARAASAVPKLCDSWVYVGSIFATVIGLVMVFGATDDARHAPFVLAIAAWLWLSLLVANVANAIVVRRPPHER